MNITPLTVNDDSRRQQARIERETAAYHRRKADECDKLASLLDAYASPEGVASDGAIVTDEGSVAARFAPVKDAA
jgi:hypothetical protein